jgi:hypothetical protein
MGQFGENEWQYFADGINWEDHIPYAKFVSKRGAGRRWAWTTDRLILRSIVFQTLET